jgi:predicted Zn finger-like uncharacterized protein
MNVRCPSCETLYRVDPAKVPREGVRASCVTCGVVFLVSQRTSDKEIREPPEAEVASREGMAPGSPEPAAAAAPPPPEPPSPPSVGMETSEPPAPVFEISSDQSSAESVGATEAQTSAPVAGPPGPSVVPPDLTDYPEPPSAGWASQEASGEEREEDERPRFELSTAEPQDEVTEVGDEKEPGTEDAQGAGLPPNAPLEPTETDEPRQQRFSRPFIAPSSASVTQPHRTPSGPMRPSAPVFRPTPGMPVRKPPPLESTGQTATPLQAPERDATGAASGVSEAAHGRRPLNPFLSRDPKQKARRLARALVSDMIVYQPKKRQDALETGTLKDVFEEEIKKSWEEYVDQVGEELANSTEYFTEALNDILAGGRQVF